VSWEEDRVEFVGLVGLLKERRLARGFTAQEVSRGSGASEGMVGKWERGTMVPGALYFIAWVRYLGLFVDVTDGAET
jgi:transcriptional regulator with XRE-family HTH domain